MQVEDKEEEGGNIVITNAAPLGVCGHKKCVDCVKLGRQERKRKCGGLNTWWCGLVGPHDNVSEWR